MKYQILHGDNRETLKTIADNSIDAIVTDPPYGIDFLGKDWDANTGALETYQECLRVLKPGGHILAFSAARTYHHLAVTLEQAGFEIRDQIMWIYSSGFPKSQDVGRSIQRTIGVEERKAHKSNLPRVGGGEDKTKAWDESAEQGQIVCTNPIAKQWEGWGTQLKPAHEPIALARKPIKLSIAKNCQQWGVGALNIDAARVPHDGPKDKPVPHGGKTRLHEDNEGWHKNNTGWKPLEDPQINEIGRFPSNVIGEILQADYQKYFYCPKVGRAERHIGHETPPPMFGDVAGAYGPDGNRMAVGFDNRAIPTHHGMIEEMGGHTTEGGGVWLPHMGEVKVHGIKHEYSEWCKTNNKTPNVGNNHPTVKPIELMKYLIKLITPPGGTVLDPFNGSGSTGCAAVELGMTYIGCELDERYVEIATRRIEAWYEHCNPTTFNQLFERAA
jgi:site-specific DNA-methyltransferase (adenine-specific)